MEVALSLGKGGCELVMLTTPDEVDQLGEASCFGNGLAQAWRQLLEPCDLESSGTPALQQLCGNVTARLASLVRSWMATTAEAWLRRQLAAGAREPRALAAACDAVGWLLREVSLHHRAAALLQDGLLLALAPQGSHLLCCLGMGACTGDQSELLQSCEDARRGHERMGTLETMAGVDLLSNIGAARWRSGDLEGAAGALQQALAIRRNTRTLESAEGAMLLRNLGVVRWAKGNYEKAIEAYGEARRVRECTGSLSGADGAVLLLNIGYAEANLGVAQRALEAFEEALSVMASASSGEGRYSSFVLPEALELAPCGATLLSSIAVAKGNCGYHDDALSAYKRAREIRQRTRTMDSPAGAVLLRNTGVALAGRADSEGALDAFLQAKAIREQTGTLVTCGGANLMAKLAALRAERGEEALRDCRTARDLHERVGTLQTPGGRTVLQLLESLQRR
ncbi:unnamed protein product [Effrenium voratum]|uniref:Uncharacterized protein n=1 Tax=Effrenium voratum TaxID=2562239 RepID=A0AA36JDS7_9DINO|nr:unnamed protein product [Effrenium voratum]